MEKMLLNIKKLLIFAIMATLSGCSHINVSNLINALQNEKDARRRKDESLKNKKQLESFGVTS